MRYNGLNAAMQSLVNFAAPAAAGAVFAVSDLRTTLMIDVVTAVVGTGLLSCLALPGQRGTRERSPLLADIRAGVSCAFSHRLAGRLLVLYGLVTFFCVPGGYLAGLFVRRTFGETYWYLTAVELAGFAGMIAGGVLMSTWGGFRRRGRTLTAGLLAFGVLAAGMGLSRHFVPYLGLMALYGTALTVVQTAITTMLQEHTEADMQGRVFGRLSTMYAGCLPLGMAIFGPLADVVSLRWIMAGAGGAILAAAAAVGTDHRMRAV